MKAAANESEFVTKCLASINDLQTHETAPNLQTYFISSTTMASSVDAKMLKATKFPPEFSQKVDMQKVNLEVMKKYVAPLDLNFELNV